MPIISRDNGNSVSLFRRIAPLEFLFPAPLDTWVVTHNLGRRPEITLIDLDGEVFHGTVLYTSLDVITITFGMAIAGRAVLH